MKNNPIDEALGLDPIEAEYEDLDLKEPKEEEKQLPEVQTEKAELTIREEYTDDELVQDLEFAKRNITSIIEQGDDSLRELIDLAKQSENPRAFEVAAGIMKTLLEANRDLVDMSRKKQDRKGELSKPNTGNDENGTKVTNNILNISTSELLKMVKGEK